MTVTVLGKNYTQLSGCESTSDGGTWTGVTTPDNRSYKEGFNSLCGTFKNAGFQDAHFVPSTPKNLLNKHVRIWIMDIFISNRDSFSNGGYQFYCSDGINTGYWYVGGNDTNPGGWWNIVVDTSKQPDAGIMPQNMDIITSMGIRVVTNILTKNTDSFWVDNLCVCDGLITYGDDSGGYYDFEDIYGVETDTVLGGWGVITKKSGVYCLVGSIEFGDATGSNPTKFQAKSQVVIFENRPDKAGTGSLINTNLLKFNIVDNGTGTTEFILGDKSGIQGIEGCIIRVQDIQQLAKYDIDASSDVDVDNFKLYGSTFLDADAISFPGYDNNSEVLSCNFESCGEINPSSSRFGYCNIISCDNRAITLQDGNHISGCNFISCPSGLSIYNEGNYTLDNLKFVGCNKDIANLSNSWISCNCINGTNASTYANPNGGTTKIINTQLLIINGIISGSEVRVYRHSDLVELAGIENNPDTNFQYNYNYAGDVDVDIVVHKNDYISLRYDSITLGDSGYTLLVQQQKDRQYFNP